MFITRRCPLFLLAPEGDPTGGEPITPEGAGTEPEPTAPGTDWEAIAKEHQAWGTRLAQEKAELETEAQIARALRSEDSSARAQALAQLGIELVDDGAPDPGAQLYEQVDPQTLARLEALEQHHAQTTAAQEREQNYAAYREITDPQLAQMQVPEGLRDVVAEAALNLPPVQTPQGPQPDLQAAYEQIQAMAEHFAALPAVQTAVKKSWQKTKPSAALTQQGGVPATQVPPLDTRVKRADYIAEQLAALDADE